jgi:ribosomal protein S4
MVLLKANSLATCMKLWRRRVETTSTLMTRLESRLDNVIFRSGIVKHAAPHASSFRTATLQLTAAA